MENVKFVYSEKMQWENSYTDRAYRKLELLCKTKFHNRYSTGFDSMDACQQMRKELSYVKQQGSAPLIIETYETLTAIEASHKDFFLKGPIGTSVILYVMGISDIEPLSVRPKVYPEFFFGIDGEKKLTIDIFVMPKLYEKLIWYFQNYIGEARLRYKLALGNGKFFGVRISDPQRNIDIENDAMEFNWLWNLGR